MLSAFSDLALVIPLDLAEHLPIGLERVGKPEIAVDDVVFCPITHIREIFKVVSELETLSQPGSQAR